MPQIDNSEFRNLCNRVQWDAPRFARAARIRKRAANAMFHDERPVPDGLMAWLREVAAKAAAVPEPPAKETH
jgi:hypothetical protein